MEVLHSRLDHHVHFSLYISKYFYLKKKSFLTSAFL